MLLINDKLVGYTCLRKKKMNYPIKKKYFLFDTLVIKKEFRKKYFRKKFFSFYIMQFNSNIIKSNLTKTKIIFKNTNVKDINNFVEKNFKEVSKAVGC